jgi:hypothetical protein
MSDDQLFRLIYATSLVLALSALALPLARGRRRWLRQAAIWVLIGGFVLAFYQVADWLIGS